MKIVKICLFLLIISFTAGCWEEEPDDSYGFCDFTYKGVNYHLDRGESGLDPIRYVPSSSGGFYAFSFDTDFGNDELSLRLYPEYPTENRDKPMCSTRILRFINLHIDGVKCGTSSNHGTITITHWDYKGGAGA